VADRFYSVVIGEHFPHQVTEGGSTSGETIELRVNDTVYANKDAILRGLEAIKSYLIVRETGPIA